MEVKEQAEMVDPFGIEAEFAEPGSTQSSILEREYDFGYGTVKVTGRDVNELIDNVAAAQNEAWNRYMQEQAQNVGVQQAPAVDDSPEIPQLSAEEEAAIGLEFGKMPAKNLRRLMESELGFSLDKLKHGVIVAEQLQRDRYETQISQEFCMRHADDYYPCQENAQAIVSYLTQNGLEASPQNLEYAYANLYRAGALYDFPQNEGDNAAPTGMDVRGGYDSGSASGLSAEEIERQAYSMPIDDLKKSLLARGR